MVNITEYFEDCDMRAEDKAAEGTKNQIEVVYPKAGENLLEFLHYCKARGSKVMLCPRCSAVFDKKAQYHFNKR